MHLAVPLGSMGTKLIMVRPETHPRPHEPLNPIGMEGVSFLSAQTATCLRGIIMCGSARLAHHKSQKDSDPFPAY